ncbi:MAG: hypothetical protein R6W96_02630 [Clostridia bacterium]
MARKIVFLFMFFAVILSSCTVGDINRIQTKYDGEPLEVAERKKIVVNGVCEFQIIGSLFTDAIRDPKQPEPYVLPKEHCIIFDVIIEIKPYQNLVPADLFEVYEKEGYPFDYLVRDSRTGTALAPTATIYANQTYVIHYYSGYHMAEAYSTRPILIKIKARKADEVMFVYKAR